MAAHAPTVSVRDRAAWRGAGQRRSWSVSRSVYVLEERVVVVPAAGVRARAVHAVGDGRCRPWVLAVFSPSGKIILGLKHRSDREWCHQVVVLSDAPHIRLQTTRRFSRAGSSWSLSVSS